MPVMNDEKQPPYHPNSVSLTQLILAIPGSYIHEIEGDCRLYLLGKKS
jgi:hypothetical protein